MLYCCGKSCNAVNVFFSFSLVSILNNQAERHLQFCCQTYAKGWHYAVRRFVCFVEGHGWQAQRENSQVYSLTPPSLSPFPCVYITPWTHPSPCRWPFRAGPRRSPRIHSAFRLSATFERPWSAATYRHSHTCALNAESQAVQGWHTTVHKVHKHTHTLAHLWYDHTSR